MTMLTDFMMAVLALYSAVRIVRMPKPNPGRLAFGWAFALTGAASVCAGVAHGFRYTAWPGLITTLFLATSLIMSLVSFLLVYAGSEGARLKKQAVDLIKIVGLCKLAFFSVWSVVYDNFITIILDYGSAMVFMVLIIALRRPKEAVTQYVSASLLIAILGAMIQQSSWSVGIFNHNDIYHVIQLASLYALYRGARLV